MKKLEVPPPRSISQLERIRLGGSEQWIRIQGKDTSNPVLLLIQQGPGLPIINEAAADRKLWRLEEEFVVVYWDQRACGKSFTRTVAPQSLTVDQLIADTHELIQALLQRFDRTQLYVTGFSFGGTIALLTASRYPELVRAVVGVGPDLRFDGAERFAYAFALEEATCRRHTRALRELERVGPPPHLSSKSFGTRAKWVTNFGGANRQETYSSVLVTTLRQLVLSRDYALAEIVGTLRGLAFTQDHLLPTLAHLDLFELLPRLDVPVFLLQGRHDFIAPPATTEQYYQALQAPHGKHLLWFDESAHMPQYEEPGKFREILLQVKQQGEAGKGHQDR